MCVYALSRIRNKFLLPFFYRNPLISTDKPYSNLYFTTTIRRITDTSRFLIKSKSLSFMSKRLFNTTFHTGCKRHISHFLILRKRIQLEVSNLRQQQQRLPLGFASKHFTHDQPFKNITLIRVIYLKNKK